MPETILVENVSNAEFLGRYAAPGRIGLYGGPELINRLISRAQRHLTEDRSWSWWSHAFLFQGQRPDGQHWLIESDLDFHRKHLRLGVQENRVSKYHDDSKTAALAVLDFGLNDAQVQRVLAAALDEVARLTHYSLRELAGVAWAMRHDKQQQGTNKMSRDRAFFCSAFVRHAFAEAGIDLVPGVDKKLTTPEHLAATTVPHTRWMLVRGNPPASRPLVKRVKAGLEKARLKAKSRLRRTAQK